MNGITVFDDTTVYVPCPASHATGGTELLHQFVHALRQQQVRAFIYYYRIKEGLDPIHPQFKKYVTDYATEIVDAPHNILVVPETRTEYLFRFKQIRKIIWWLSVDFFYDYADVDRISTLKKLLGITKRFSIRHPERTPVDLHLVQSQYAAAHLEKNHITRYEHLSDYLNAAFVQASSNTREKKNRVLYNPKKGFEFTRKIIDQSPELDWFPLINLTPAEVADVCQTSKLYIDFGHHPGKDRFPREAAISGCCIITGKRGAAGNTQDIPIPGKYKFEDNTAAIPAIIRQIKYCLENFEQCQQDFDAYRANIRQQEKEFNEQLAHIFIKDHSAQKQAQQATAL